jgi:hypothetical protein
MIRNEYLILITLFFFLLLIMIYLYLIWRKIRNNIDSNHKRAWFEGHQEQIEMFLLTGVGGTFIPTKRFHFEALEEYFSDYLSNFKLESDINPLKTFIEKYFVPRYRKRLFNSSWSIRMNTLYFIDLFKIEMMQEDLLKHFKRKKCSPVEQYLIFILLAKFEYKSLKDLIKDSRRIPPFLLKVMISRLIANNFENYVQDFNELPYEWKLSALDVFGDQNWRSIKLQELLEGLLKNDDQELRIRAAKTIANLEYITSPDILVEILEKLKTTEWQEPMFVNEKMMLARIIGNIKYEQFIPYLKLLICDKGYIVRSEAAKSIRKYKSGKDILLSISENHPDNYARNIAKEWWERSVDYD